MAVCVLCGCASSNTPTAPGFSYVESMKDLGDGEGFMRVTGPRILEFPRDHGEHSEYRTEWWYFTGNLESDRGAEFGYQLTFFRIGLPLGAEAANLETQSNFSQSSMFMGHFAISSLDQQSYMNEERVARAATELAEVRTVPHVTIALDEWRAEFIDESTVSLHAHAVREGEEHSIALTLRTERPPLLHGDAGYSRKGPGHGQASFYYSVLFTDTVGSLVFQGEEFPVSGRSWFDHEWGSSTLSPASEGWDWFGLHYADGSAIMAAQVRLEEGVPDPAFTSTYLSPTGEVYKVPAGELHIQVNDWWLSDATGHTYPSQWVLDFSQLDLRCEVTSLLADQEFRGMATYWEGAVASECVRGGVSTLGRGYVELTGY